MPASLLLIDADLSASSGLRYALLQEGYRVTHAEPGLGAIRRMITDEPDLVILGVNCLRGDWHFCHRLLSFVEKPLLLLLSTSSPMDQVRGLEMGADDCMIRPVSTIEFLARIRALLRRNEHTTQSARRECFVDDDLVLDLRRQEVWLCGQSVALTPTEFRILSCFARHVDEVLSHKRLSMQIWGPDHSDASDTIRQHVHQLRQKIEPNPRHPQRIITRRGEGYLFRSLTNS